MPEEKDKPRRGWFDSKKQVIKPVSPAPQEKKPEKKVGKHRRGPDLRASTKGSTYEQARNRTGKHTTDGKA